MKTTIELPDELLVQTKLEAARRQTSIKQLVIQGLETILENNNSSPDVSQALERLNRGYHLGGKPLSREEIYAEQ